MMAKFLTTNFGHLNDEGFTPGNKLNRTSFSAGGRAELSNNFTISGTMNYSRTDFSTPPVARWRFRCRGRFIYFADIFIPKKRGLDGLIKSITGSNVSYRSASDFEPLLDLNNSSILN
jgi:hypothetical protein